MSNVRNVIIIGSGPAGYTAAIYAARANLQPLVFEGSVTAGGALMNTTDVENFPGFPEGIMGPALMDNLRGQAERFGAELVADDVTEVELTGDVKVVRLADGTEHTARAMILAMGSGYRKLGLARATSPTCGAIPAPTWASRRRRPGPTGRRPTGKSSASIAPLPRAGHSRSSTTPSPRGLRLCHHGSTSTTITDPTQRSGRSHHHQVGQPGWASQLARRQRRHHLRERRPRQRRLRPSYRGCPR